VQAGVLSLENNVAVLRLALQEDDIPPSLNEVVTLYNVDRFAAIRSLSEQADDR
jgi:hypothetical protein